MQDFVNNVNNNTTTDDAGSVNGDSNDGLDSDLNTEQLDTPIAINKIIQVLSQLKHNKCADLNSVLADFFIESKQFISPFLCFISNHSFNTGIQYYLDSIVRVHGFMGPRFKQVYN